MTDKAPNTGNHRVTNAIILTKLEHLADDVREVKTSVKEDLKNHDERITANRETTIQHTEQIRNRSVIAVIAQAISTGIGFVFGGQ